MKKQIVVAENLFEETPHGDFAFPFVMEPYVLSEFEHGSFAVHWHPELEFTVILDGAMEYQANNTVYRLEAGSGIFVNANCLHTARSYEGQDCSYLVATCHPLLLYGYDGSAVEKKYVTPILEAPDFTSFYLDPASEMQGRMLRLLLETNRLFTEPEAGYELRIKSRLCEFWSLLYGEFRRAGREPVPGAKDIAALKQALNFIHSHFAEKITLDEIAAAGSMSKSTCCRFFRETMRQTPFEYLLKYRVQRSIPYLLQQADNVTEISEKVGFSGASYYSEIFRKYMSCSPSEYRRRQLPKE